jgi:hypothetical protein
VRLRPIHSASELFEFRALLDPAMGKPSAKELDRVVELWTSMGSEEKRAAYFLTAFEEDDGGGLLKKLSDEQFARLSAAQ